MTRFRPGILRVALAGSLGLSAIVAFAPRATAQAAPNGRQVFVFTMQDAALADLLSTPGFLALAMHGGAGLLSVGHPGDPTFELDHARGEGKGVLPFWSAVDLGSMAGPGGIPSPEKLDAAAARTARGIDSSLAEEASVFVVSSPPAGAPGERLGAVVMAEGAPDDLVAAMGSASATGTAGALTSDSTRRRGVVTTGDVAATAISSSQVEALVNDPGGAEIRVISGPPPLDLYERYGQSKRLAVPVGTAVALFVTIAGLVALVTLLWAGSPRWSRSVMGWVAISSPFLALSLLLAGHLPSLTYGTAIPCIVVITATGTLALVPIVRRRGTLVAIAAAGVILLATFAVEAALGWSAALTPLLGGSQLDGGRFFGLPNAFIGLLLGGAIYVAQRLSRTAGTILIAATGLFAGLPWTGSNIGGAVTLFAGAGIWWGLRGGLGWLRTSLAAAVSVTAGTGLVVIAHRYLSSAPTHITRFAEHSGGVAGVWSKLVDRLQVGADLIARNPFAVVPVIGVLFTLLLIVRPPRAVRVTFTEAPVWRSALLAIALGSLVAYVVNDSGAAAIGEGFTTSFAALLYVSLLRRNDIMEEA